MGVQSVENVFWYCLVERKIHSICSLESPALLEGSLRGILGALVWPTSLSPSTEEHGAEFTPGASSLRGGCMEQKRSARHQYREKSY